MRKISLLSVMVGLLMVGLLMVACNGDNEGVTSCDTSNIITYNADYSENVYQEANKLALELTGYSYKDIKDFNYVSEEWHKENVLEEPECTDATMAPGGPWYCWVLLYGCLLGCDQNHGGSLCEDICFNSFNSCGGGTEATRNIVN